MKMPYHKEEKKKGKVKKIKEIIESAKKEEQEFKMLERELKEKIKMVLFDLYDRCFYPIARVLEVKINPEDWMGASYVIKIKGDRFQSGQFERIKQIAEEILKRKLNLEFTILIEEKELKAIIVLSDKVRKKSE